MSNITNKIFYGSYCTGKTFAAILEALKIVGSNNVKDDPEYIYSKEEISMIMNEFEMQRRIGAIEFITFHDSYNYNDFIESPVYTKEELIGIDDNACIKDGIFKKIANEALFECIDISEEKKQEFYNFKNFINSLKALYPPGTVIKTANDSFTITRYLDQYIAIKGTQGSSIIQLKYSVIEDMLETVMPAGFTIRRCTSVHQPQNLQEILDEYKEYSTYYLAIFNEMKNFSNIIKAKLIEAFYKGKYQLKKEGAKPFVVIIDEINHGNIKKLFGEVLSLLDDSTRGELSATLLYSQKRFVLPTNLHIIGTLSTPELIDTTVYKYMRHFNFQKTEPNSNLVADFGCNFAKKFDILNKRIAALTDKRYRIGHCYFLKTKYENAGPKELRKIWQNNILPLLNVQLGNDWEKLQILLGEAKQENSFIQQVNAYYMPEKYIEKNGFVYDFADLNSALCTDEMFVNMLEHAFPNE